MRTDQADTQRAHRECRHPNIVQFIGLCLAPTPAPDYLPPLSFDNSGRVQTKPPAARRRILIISEYLPNGNLRSHIVNQRLDFSWRLRLSFAVDVARAVAYLHARNCLHRDLKGENLLITENDRIKVRSVLSCPSSVTMGLNSACVLAGVRFWLCEVGSQERGRDEEDVVLRNRW